MMPEREGQVFIGTSGWVYNDWEGMFYPPGISSEEKLKFFSQHFRTAEVNYSFYHVPKSSTYEKWYQNTPSDFIFAVKVSRFITHIKRVKGGREAWKKFLGNALFLKEKLGPMLFQLPPSFRHTAENFKRLENFLQFISTFKLQTMQRKPRFAFEFRHQTMCAKEVYDLLKAYNVAWVISDSSRYPKAEVVTADFIYLRMHGPTVLFSSKYTAREMKVLGEKIDRWRIRGLDVYVYFNNDVSGFAVENARELLKSLA